MPSSTPKRAKPTPAAVSDKRKAQNALKSNTAGRKEVATVSVGELRSNFKAIEAQLATGTRIQVTRRGTVIAEMLPPAVEASIGDGPAPYQKPDFMARLKAIWGDTPWDIDTTAMVSEGRERDPLS